MVDVVVELLIQLDDLLLPEELDTDLLHQDDELVAHPGNTYNLFLYLILSYFCIQN